MTFIPVTACMRCYNDLNWHEMQAKAFYCAPCQKLLDAQEHKAQQGKDLGRANGKVRL